MSNDLEKLIEASLNDEVGKIDTRPRLSTDTQIFDVNHPISIVLAWLLLSTVALFTIFNPLIQKEGLGVRSTDTRLGVSLFHLAHHIESHRRDTGVLPEYIEADWTDLQDVQYQKTKSGYKLHGRLGSYELTYREGDNPEALLQQSARLP